MKAHLVARGFEKDHLAKLHTDLPTCEKESLRILIAIIINNGWETNSLHFVNKFGIQNQHFYKERRFCVTYF